MFVLALLFFAIGLNLMGAFEFGNLLPQASRFNLAARLQQSFALGSGRFDWQALVNCRSSYFLSQFNESDIALMDGSHLTALQPTRSTEV